MDNRYSIFGLTSLGFFPIFTLIYLQNEIFLFENLQLKSTNIISMLISFILISINFIFNQLWIQIFCTILLILALSLSINYTYRDYTIDEGYYISIPYFIIYSCFIFLISIYEYSYINIDLYQYYVMLLACFSCYLLFSINISYEKYFQGNICNYIAFIGLCISTFNVVLIINCNQQMKLLIINFLIFYLVHIYLYITHLLSIQFELC